MTAAKHNEEDPVVTCNDCQFIRLECQKRCDLRHKEVEGMKNWVGTIDKRLWALLVLAVVQLCALGGVLLKVAFAK